jgi:hypothetical protein
MFIISLIIQYNGISGILNLPDYGHKNDLCVPKRTFLQLKDFDNSLETWLKLSFSSPVSDTLHVLNGGHWAFWADMPVYSPVQPIETFYK